ncbi:Enoyl-CoA hydratase domain-containing protein 2, mitochondrial, partial [Clarias magur]
EMKKLSRHRAHLHPRPRFIRDGAGCVQRTRGIRNEGSAFPEPQVRSSRGLALRPCASSEPERLPPEPLIKLHY